MKSRITPMKPERRMDEVNRQMKQRKELNEKLGRLVSRCATIVADARAKAPPKASSFDRVVEDTQKA